MLLLYDFIIILGASTDLTVVVSYRDHQSYVNYNSLNNTSYVLALITFMQNLLQNLLRLPQT